MNLKETTLRPYKSPRTPSTIAIAVFIVNKNLKTYIQIKKYSI